MEKLLYYSLHLSNNLYSSTPQHLWLFFIFCQGNYPPIVCILCVAGSEPHSFTLFCPMCRIYKSIQLLLFGFLSRVTRRLMETLLYKLWIGNSTTLKLTTVRCDSVYFRIPDYAIYYLLPSENVLSFETRMPFSQRPTSRLLTESQTLTI